MNRHKYHYKYMHVMREGIFRLFFVSTFINGNISNFN